MSGHPRIDFRVECSLGPALSLARRRFLAALLDPSFIKRCLARYAEGQAEYGHRYEWLRWDADRFNEEIGQEIADVVIYTAMELARRQEVGPPS